VAVNLPWTCPYCRRDTTIVDAQFSSDRHTFSNNNKLGDLWLNTNVFVCPNKDCREFAIVAELYNMDYNGFNGNARKIGQPILSWKLKPQSSAKPYPEYIPNVIRKDYEEACLILNLSPKASATLSRRCMQGMIRNFWGVSKQRLVDEIEAIQDLIDPLTWQAIETVRNIGNIGAHMEKDIDLIIDVEPHEAELLIGLIETLFDDWYINRHRREEKLKGLIAVGTEKKAQKSEKKKS
jgi:hypothetical protein